MTEDEAKTKWCPMARVWSGGGAAFNRKIDEHVNCYGSGCMMWRWANEKNPDYVPQHNMLAQYPQHPAAMQGPWRKSETQGYCGMGGQ